MYGGDFHVGGQLVQGVGKEAGIDRHDLSNSSAGLDGHRRDGGDPVAAVGGDGLDVSRDPGAGRGVETGNRQHHRRTLRHSLDLVQNLDGIYRKPRRLENLSYDGDACPLGQWTRLSCRRVAEGSLRTVSLIVFQEITARHCCNQMIISSLSLIPRKSMKKQLRKYCTGRPLAVIDRCAISHVFPPQPHSP